MTFEGFDAAPLIESGRFSPELAAMAEPAPATLDAALREAARAERAATRADALVLDLWVRPGGGFEILDLPKRGATSAQAWAVPSGDNDQAAPDGGKDFGLRAAYGDKPPEPKPNPKEGDDEVVVKGIRSKVMDGDGTGGMDGGWGGDPPGGWGGEPVTPNCSNSNEITQKDAPDGAKYLVPEDISAADLEEALTYIHNLSVIEGKSAVLQAIYNMYENPSHPHFVDFKDWGTSNGPAGSQGAGTITYFSTSLGQTVTSPAFEPFGNYFFGVICTVGGLSAAETRAAAALSQSGRLNELAGGDLTALIDALVYGDDPQDRPFVTDGINDGLAYARDPFANGHQFGVKEGNCGSSSG